MAGNMSTREYMRAIADDIGARNNYPDFDLCGLRVYGETCAAELLDATKADPTDECPICLEPYGAGTTPKKTLCKHVFHEACIAKYFETDDHCQVCRRRAMESSSLSTCSGDTSTTEISETDLEFAAAVNLATNVE